jgi:hypothetical protein
MRRRCRMTVRTQGPSSAVLLLGGMQYPIHCSLRRQITALVGQARDDLARRQMRIVRTTAQRQNGLPLTLTESIERARTDCGGAAIGFQSALLCPALQRAQGNAQLITGRFLASTGGGGFFNPFDIKLPYWQRGQVSSLSSPQ